MRTKYKAKDVLTTRMNKIFTITQVYRKYMGVDGKGKQIFQLHYKLNGHPWEEIPVDYLDNAPHIDFISGAGKVLFGK